MAVLTDQYRWPEVVGAMSISCVLDGTTKEPGIFGLCVRVSRNDGPFVDTGQQCPPALLVFSLVISSHIQM